MIVIKEIEKRFLEVQTNQIDKFKSKKFGEVFTPTHLARKMVDKVDNYKHIRKTLDLCAGHGVFTIELIKKYAEVQKENFNLNEFFENHYCSELQEESIQKLKYIFGPQLNIISGDSRKIKQEFDLCFSNPPYTRGIDLKILSVIEPLCNEIVAVHPSTYFLDMKKKYKPYKVFRNQIEGKVKSVEFFNGNPVFNIGLFVPCMILHLDKKHSGKIKANYFGDEFESDCIADITKFGKEWKTIVEPFFLKMKSWINENSSIWEHNITEIEENIKNNDSNDFFELCKRK